MTNFLMYPIQAGFLLLAPQILWAGYSQEEPMDVVKTPSKPVSTKVKGETPRSKSRRGLKSKRTLKTKRNLKRKISHSGDALQIKKKQRLREEKKSTPLSTPFSLRLSTQSPEQLRGPRTVIDPVEGECVNLATDIARNSDGSQMELCVRGGSNKNASGARVSVRCSTFSPDFFCSAGAAHDSPGRAFPRMFLGLSPSPDGTNMVMCGGEERNSTPIGRSRPLHFTTLPPELFIGTRTVYNPYGGVFDEESPSILSYLSPKELGQLAGVCRLMWVYVKDFMSRRSCLRLELGPKNIEPFLQDHLPAFLVRQWTNITLPPVQKKSAPCRIQSFSFSDPASFLRFARHFTLGMRQSALFNFLGTEENEITLAGVSDLVAAISEVGLKKLALVDHPSLEASVINELLCALPEGLVELKLSYVAMREDTARVLAKVISKLPLKLLDISGNMVKEAGITSLAEALPSTLEILNVAQNEAINEAGIRALAQALRLNLRIKELNLSGNGLEEDCLKELFAILSRTGIRHLDLSYNFLEDGGAKALVKVLPWTQIVSLRVKGNDIGLEVKAMFLRLQNVNQEAIAIDL